MDALRSRTARGLEEGGTASPLEVRAVFSQGQGERGTGTVSLRIDFPDFLLDLPRWVGWRRSPTPSLSTYKAYSDLFRPRTNATCFSQPA